MSIFRAFSEHLGFYLYSSPYPYSNIELCVYVRYAITFGYCLEKAKVVGIVGMVGMVGIVGIKK